MKEININFDGNSHDKIHKMEGFTLFGFYISETLIILAGMVSSYVSILLALLLSFPIL